MTRGLQQVLSETEIEETISAAARDVIPAGIISQVTFDKDFRAEDVVRIQILFRSDKIEPKDMLDFATLIRRNLIARGEAIFPMVSFIAESDLKARDS